MLFLLLLCCCCSYDLSLKFLFFFLKNSFILQKFAFSDHYHSVLLIFFFRISLPFFLIVFFFQIYVVPFCISFHLSSQFLIIIIFSFLHSSHFSFHCHVFLSCCVSFLHFLAFSFFTSSLIFSHFFDFCIYFHITLNFARIFHKFIFPFGILCIFTVNFLFFFSFLL